MTGNTPNSVGATLTYNQSGNPPDYNGTNFITSGGSVGNVIVNSQNAVPPYTITEIRLGHSTQKGSTLTLNGEYSKIYYNECGIPIQSSIILQNSASITQLIAVNPICLNGITGDRPPTPYIGQIYFDTTITRPIWWNGVNWINASGVVV